MPKQNKCKAKILIYFLIYEILFILVTSPFYVYKGPFNSLKKIVVATIMATRHQYLVTSFLSQEEIDNIINKNNFINNIAKENPDNVKIIKDDTAKIACYEVNSDSGRYNGYLLSIPSTYKIKVALTKNLGKEGQRTSEMAKEHNALAAINGGAFTDNKSQTYGGSAAYPGGFVISDGNVIYKNEHISYDSKECVTAFTKSGQLIVGNHSINDLENMDVSEAVCFKPPGFIPPALVIKGKGQVADAAATGLNPRTAIGQTDDGTILFLVLDGRKNFVNSGASLKDVQDLMLKHGAVNATSLDGGFSSTMYYNGKVINNTHSWNGERYVATSLYVEP